MDAVELKKKLQRDKPVYLAWDKNMKQTVVVKTCSLVDDDRLEDPLNEIKCLKRLSSNGGHPNIVRMFHHEKMAGKLWISQEAGGKDLYDIISGSKKQRLSREDIKHLFRQLIRGVKFIHSCGIAHLDLSLENLVVSSDLDVLKIIDFGLARFIKFDEDGSSVDFPGISSPGKTFYMSPEIFSYQAFAGPAADIWSCGVILFMLLLGGPPFRKPHKSDKRFSMIFNGRLGELLQRWKVRDIPDSAIDLLSMCLGPSSGRPSADDILNHPFLGQKEKIDDTVVDGKHDSNVGKGEQASQSPCREQEQMEAKLQVL